MNSFSILFGMQLFIASCVLAVVGISVASSPSIIVRALRLTRDILTTLELTQTCTVRATDTPIHCAKNHSRFPIARSTTMGTTAMNVLA